MKIGSVLDRGLSPLPLMAPISPLVSSDELFRGSPPDESDEPDDHSNSADTLAERVVSEGAARPAASDEDGHDRHDPGVKSVREACHDSPAASAIDTHGGSPRGHGTIRRMSSSHSLRRRALSSPYIRVSRNNAGGASQQQRNGEGGYVVRSMSGHMPDISGTLKISPEADELILGGRRAGHSRSLSDPQGGRKVRQDEGSGTILRLLQRSASACGRLERTVRRALLSQGKRQCEAPPEQTVVMPRRAEREEVVLAPLATNAANDVVAVCASAPNASGASSSTGSSSCYYSPASASPAAPAVAPARTNTNPGKCLVPN